MKFWKFSSAILVFGLIGFTLSGCQLFEREKPPPAAFQEEFKIEKKIGVIESFTRTGLRASHVLKTDQNEEIPLRSGSVNLKKYEKRQVEVEGKFATTDSVFEVEDVEKLGNEDQLREIYRHFRLGFSTLFVPTWQVTEKELGLLFTPYPADEEELVDRISISKLSNEKKLAPSEWLDLDPQLNPKDPADDAFYIEAIIGPDQLKGIKKTSRDGSRIDFYIQREDSIYRVSHVTVKDEDEEKYRNIFFEMVNSFQFIATSEGEPQTLPVPSNETQAKTEMPPETIPPSERRPSEELSEKPPSQEPLGDGTDVYGKATIKSRGLKVQMEISDLWYWEQVGNELVFTDDYPLDKNGTIVMRLRKGKTQPLPPDMVEKCKIVSEAEYCIVTQKDWPYGEVDQILKTVEAYMP